MDRPAQRGTLGGTDFGHFSVLEHTADDGFGAGGCFRLSVVMVAVVVITIGFVSTRVVTIVRSSGAGHTAEAPGHGSKNISIIVGGFSMLLILWTGPAKGVPLEALILATFLS